MAGMGIAEWLAQNWFNALSSIGIMGSFWVGILALRSAARAAQVSNLLAVTASYREIWKDYHARPGLARVLDAAADVPSRPVTPEEDLFVRQVIFQLATFFYASRGGLLIDQAGARRDVRDFFSLPVPRAVWEKSKPLQNRDFAAFVDSSLERQKPA